MFASWGMSFLYRVCMVLGWTVLTAFFVAEYGIAFLPLLFVLHAIGNMLGTFTFASFISKVRKVDVLLYLSIALAFIFGFAAFSYMFSDIAFLIFSILGVSVGLYQYKIVRALFSESRFTPSQATRVFPVIESAETLGVIVGGALVVLFSSLISLNKIFLVMMAVILLSVPLLLWYMTKTLSVPFKSYFNIPELNIKVHEDTELSFADMFRRVWKSKFVYSLFLIVFLQYFFFGILEYQFTSVVEAYGHKAHDGGDVGKNLAYDLGLIHTVFGGLILVFQLFVASRILKFSGIVKSMLVTPVVMLVSVIFMIASFAFPSVVMARFNQELTYVLHYNSYHASYYALSHGFRVALMEFLEGFVRPLGTVFATIVIFILNFYYPGSFNLVANIVSIALLVLLFVSTLKFGGEYKSSPKNTLRFSNSTGDLINAMDLLEDFEDKDEVISFLKDLLSHRNDLPLVVSQSLYRFIANHGEVDDIYYLILAFDSSEDKTLVLKAINDLFLRFKDELHERVFTWQYLKNFYKDLSSVSLDHAGRLEFLQFLSLFYLESRKIKEFNILLESNLSSDTVEVFAIILEDYRDKGLYLSMKDYLAHNDPLVRMSFLILFKDYISKQELNLMVRSCLISSSFESVYAGLLFVLKTKRFDLISLYEEMLKEKTSLNAKCKFLLESIFYLRDKDEYCYSNYLDTLDLGMLTEFYSIADNWKFGEGLVSRIFDAVENRVYNIYSKFGEEDSPEAKLGYLNELKSCYLIIDAHKEYYMIDDMLS